jgi:hypothetical protein
VTRPPPVVVKLSISDNVTSKLLNSLCLGLNESATLELWGKVRVMIRVRVRFGSGETTTTAMTTEVKAESSWTLWVRAALRISVSRTPICSWLSACD